MALKVIRWSTGNVGRYASRSMVGHPAIELAELFVSGEAKEGKDALLPIGLEMSA
jgi:4-hydroxy-tetrahydrodipicolinate reductase